MTPPPGPLTDFLQRAGVLPHAALPAQLYEGAACDPKAARVGGPGVYLVAATRPWPRDPDEHHPAFEIIYVGGATRVNFRVAQLIGVIPAPSPGRVHPMAFKMKSYPCWLPTHELPHLRVATWSCLDWKQGERELQDACERIFGALPLYNGFDHRRKALQDALGLRDMRQRSQMAGAWRSAPVGNLDDLSRND